MVTRLSLSSFTTLGLRPLVRMRNVHDLIQLGARCGISYCSYSFRRSLELPVSERSWSRVRGRYPLGRAVRPELPSSRYGPRTADRTIHHVLTTSLYRTGHAHDSSPMYRNKDNEFQQSGAARMAALRLWPSRLLALPASSATFLRTVTPYS